VRASQLPTNVLGQEPTAVNAPRGGSRTPGEEPTRALETRRITVAAASESTMVMDRYRLTKRLGSGAFGTVWSARDERLDRDVAVKILPRERVIHARFEREARAAARLQHPAIVTLYEAAVDDEGAYLVSELVRGRTLDALLEQGKLSDREILEVGVALCDALAHAHGQGVIHRDVKPSNVLIPNRGGGGRAGGTPYGDRAKLTDFGVAHVIGGATLTHTGDVVGTLAYMAPEQAEGREAGKLRAVATAAPRSFRRCAASAATSAGNSPAASIWRCVRDRTIAATCSICARRCCTRSTRPTTRPASSHPAGTRTTTTPGSTTSPDRSGASAVTTTLPAYVCPVEMARYPVPLPRRSAPPGSHEPPTPWAPRSVPPGCVRTSGTTLRSRPRWRRSPPASWRCCCRWSDRC
jgi:serine/threonine protein kinase